MAPFDAVDSHGPDRRPKSLSPTGPGKQPAAAPGLELGNVLTMAPGDRSERCDVRDGNKIGD